MGLTHLRVHVQPGAKRSEITGVVGGVVRIRIAAAAHEGKANKALEEFLAERLDLPKSKVRIVRGATSRDKIVEIEGVSEEDAWKKLAQG